MTDEHHAANGWIGARVPRLEDRALVTGRATYVDDLLQTDALHMAVLRSPYAHARLLSVNTVEAAALPGVVAVLTAEGVVANSDPVQPLRILPGQKDPRTYALATDRVRYVGEPVVAVAAVDRYVAEDALELIEVDYEPLDPVLDPEAALEDGSPLLYDDWGDNEQFRMRLADGDVDAALATCDLVIQERLHIQRQAGVPLEARGVVASYDPARDLLTFQASSQKIHTLQTLLARALRINESQLRVVAPNLGGGFGVKGDLYREDVLAALLARRAGRSVKWVEDRREHFLGSVHAREQLHDVTIGARSDGTLVAFRDHVVADLGSRTHTVGPSSVGSTLRMLPGPYHLQAFLVEAQGVVTNKVPAGAYRGYGNPEANFVMERCVDLVATRLGLDPADVRRRNLVRPDELPYRTVTAQNLDSGDYPAAFEQALDLADYANLRAQQAAWRAEGRHVGVGIATYVEATGLPGTAAEPVAGDNGPAAGYERAVIELNQHAQATVYSGLMDMGQGLATTFRQIAAQQIGIAPEAVRVVLGDTTVCPYSPGGSSASRSLVMGGNAVGAAAGKVRAKLQRLAAHTLEAAPDDLELADGTFRVKGAPERSKSVLDLARIAYSPSALPADEDLGLTESGTFATAKRPYAYGTHVAVVEVFPQTGKLEILKYVVVDDCGVVVNPMIVEGQVHGGVTQGLAGALLEELVYDEGGQLATASFMDYLLPTAMDVPPFVLGHVSTPSPNNPLGVKGVGESGTICPPAAIANAVADALHPTGLQINQTPVTPARLWQAVQSQGLAAAD